MSTFKIDNAKKFGDLTKITTPPVGSLLLLHDGSGVKTITAENLANRTWQDMEPAEGMTAAYAKFIRLTDSLALAVIDISANSGTFVNLQKLCSFPAGVNALLTTYQPCTYLQGSSLAPGLVYPGGRSASGGPGVYTNYGFTDKNRVIATLILELLQGETT